MAAGVVAGEVPMQGRRPSKVTQVSQYRTNREPGDANRVDECEGRVWTDRGSHGAEPKAVQTSAGIRCGSDCRCVRGWEGPLRSRTRETGTTEEGWAAVAAAPPGAHYGPQQTLSKPIEILRFLRIIERVRRGMPRICDLPP